MLRKQGTKFDRRIRLFARLAIVMAAMAGFLGWTWFNEDRTGVSQIGRGGIYYRAFDPSGFAFSHHRTLLSAELFALGALVTCAYLGYCVVRRRKLRND